MGVNAIEIEQLGKRYRLGELRAVGTSLGEMLSARGRRERKRQTELEDLWALRDVTFAVEEGELLGLIGGNGAGKSTLLKVLARITDPTEGRVRMRGRIGALLEVGTAFHPELTGRENIAVNGALFGMSRNEVRRKFDDIVEFAGVEEFLETPLKRYSTGMGLRLAFSVATHFEPEIVVVDEVLAVGDAAFQRRCMDKMADVGRDGRTVVFVSHDMGSVGRLCSRCVWLDHGRVRDDGPAGTIIERYLRSDISTGSSVTLPEDPSAPVRLVSIAIDTKSDTSAPTLLRTKPLEVRLAVEVAQPTPGLEVSCHVVNSAGAVLIDESLADNERFDGALDAAGRYDIDFHMPPILVPGEYTVGAWLGTDELEFFFAEVIAFHVLPAPADPAETVERNRIVSPTVTWQVRPVS